MTLLEYIDNLITEVHALNDPGKLPLSQTDIINHYLNSLATLRSMAQGSASDLEVVVSGVLKDLDNVIEKLVDAVS